jgi:pyruvate ferredoxin oxidoreductase gamma subunit
MVLAPVTQLDRVLASEAGCGRSSRPRGIFFNYRLKTLFSVGSHPCRGGARPDEASIKAQVIQSKYFLRRKKIDAKLIAIRIHGRGGQGAVTSAELLAQAAIAEGKYAQAFPSFGPERRGALVQAFVRISSEPIRIRAEVTEPDIVIVLDPGLLTIVKVTGGLAKNGLLVVNAKTFEAIPLEIRQNYRVATVDANRIARDVLGVPIVNTTMLGALLKVTGVVGLDSLNEPLQKRFGKLAEKNLSAMKRALDETTLEEVAHA